MTEADIHHWTASLFECCAVCRQVSCFCRNCGSGLTRGIGVAILLPATSYPDCYLCGQPGLLTIPGWESRTRLEEAFALPAAIRAEHQGPRRAITEWATDLDLGERIRRTGPGLFSKVAAFYRHTGRQPRRVSGPCRTRAFVYTKAELIAALDYINETNRIRGGSNG